MPTESARSSHEISHLSQVYVEPLSVYLMMNLCDPKQLNLYVYDWHQDTTLFFLLPQKKFTCLASNQFIAVLLVTNCLYLSTLNITLSDRYNQGCSLFPNRLSNLSRITALTYRSILATQACTMFSNTLKSFNLPTRP